MSPFSHFRSEITPGGSIDRKFSPLFNFIDEFDRHFSHHHHSGVNPHFDLEEDATNYFLIVELPGTTAADITIEASPHDDHTITISGSVPSTLHGSFAPGKAGAPVGDHVNGANGSVEILGNGKGYVDHDIRSDPAPSAEKQEMSGNTGKDSAKEFGPTGRRVLLSERLTGGFHRSFSFPSSIVEENVKASAENGLLYLVVPKKVHGLAEKAKKKIPIASGKPHGWYVGPNNRGPAMIGPTVI